MKDLDVGAYLKTIGKKYLTFIVLGLLTAGSLGVYLYMYIQQTAETTNALYQEMQEADTENVSLLRDKRDNEELELLIAEYEEAVGEQDLNVHTLDVLSTIEELAVSHSLTNTEHEVLERDELLDEPTVPIHLSLEGSYANVTHYIQELNQSDVPLALRDMAVFVDEERYSEFQGSEKVEMEVMVYVFEDITVPDKGVRYALEEEYDSPFGYFVYQVEEEEESSSLDDYQQFLQQYVQDQEEKEEDEVAEVEDEGDVTTPPVVEEDMEEEE